VHIDNFRAVFTLSSHDNVWSRPASVLPLLPWCERFELVARCILRGRAVSVRMRPGDPIAVGDPPRAYDSCLEERFARELSAPTWIGNSSASRNPSKPAMRLCSRTLLSCIAATRRSASCSRSLVSGHPITFATSSIVCA